MGTWGWSLLLVCLSACVTTPTAQAFIHENPTFEPWLNTALGTRTGNGKPVKLTWSLVGDGTLTPDIGGTQVGSNLISFLDSTFGGNPSGANPNDLTKRPWFNTLRQPFDRWEAISGIDFIYSASDDDVVLGNFPGQSGVRGDIRIGGRNVDGPSGTLAFAFTPIGFPSDGEIVIDTSDTSFYGNSVNNYLPLRNTLAHELGHSLNMRHINSTTDQLLLEATINTSFDGPQLDEVRAAHFFYGDKFEKTNNNLGNGTPGRATNLGTLTAGVTRHIGKSADVPTQAISATSTDFVSISHLNDADYFSFTVSQPGFLDAVLKPLGGTFNQGSGSEVPAYFNANARNDLVLTLFGTNGVTPLATANSTHEGDSESLINLALPSAGKYYARVSGLDDTIQLYQLGLTLKTVALLVADLNADGFVDGQDLGRLLTNWGQNGTASQGELDGISPIDGQDLGTLLGAWNPPQSLPLSALHSVPEPASMGLAALGLFSLAMLRAFHRSNARCGTSICD